MRACVRACVCCMLVQSVSVFSLAVFLRALLPEIKWMNTSDGHARVDAARFEHVVERLLPVHL